MGGGTSQRKKRGRKATPHELVNGVDGKRCRRCTEWKPLTAYGPRKRAPDGLRSRCQPCHFATAAESRKRQRNGTAKKIGPNLKLNWVFVEGKGRD